MAGIRSIYLEATPLKNGNPVTVRMTRAGASAEGVLCDGKSWVPCITKRQANSMSIASDGLLSIPDTAPGSIEINITADLGNEEWSAYEWSGALARLWIGVEGDPLSSYKQTFQGPLGSISSKGSRASLPLLGAEALLTGDLLSLTYQGTGGIEGPPDLAGNLKPRAFGACQTVAPVQIDTVYLVHQVHGYGAVDAIPAVYDFGIALDPARNKGDVANYNALIALTLVRGEWATCRAQGLFRLGAPSTHKISADVTVGTGTIAAIGRQLLNIAGVTNAQIGDLSQFNGRPWCLFQSSQASILEATRSAFNQGGGYLFCDGTGTWRVGDYMVPKTPIRIADDGSTLPILKSISELASAAPVWRVFYGYDRCWDVHGSGDVSPVLAQVTDLQLAQQNAIDEAVAAAEAAQADADQAKDRIAVYDSDGILSPSEKLNLIRDFQAITVEYSGLANQGSQFNVTVERAAYVAKYQALSDYLNNSLANFFDTTKDTPIVPATDAQKWNDLYGARAALRLVLTGKVKSIADAAATTAVWSGVTGPGKPADNADVTANNTSANTAAVGSLPAAQIVAKVNNALTDQSQTIVNIDSRITDIQNKVNSAGSGQQVVRIDALEASARGQGISSPNLVGNSQFTDTSGTNGQIAGWTVGSGSWTILTPYDVGPFIQSGNTNAFIWQDINVSTNTLYSLGAEMSPDTSNTCYVKVDWLNSGGGIISGSQYVYANGWTRGYTADNSLQSPSSAAKARVYCCTTGNLPSGQNGRITRVQFQRGGTPTPYRDDGDDRYSAAKYNSQITLINNTVGNYGTQISDLTSQFAGNKDSWMKSQIGSIGSVASDALRTASQTQQTLTSTIGSLNSPNLLYNGSFANGLQGWTRSSDAWFVISQYDPIFVQYPNRNGNGYIFSDVKGIIPGKNYCVSFESNSDSGANYCYMAIQWMRIDNSQITQVDANPATNPGNGWGPDRRINRGPYTAPQGTAYARVVLYTYGGGSSGSDNNIRAARLQFQQSDTSTAYSDASSLQAVQAQVTQQAGTIADIQNNKLQAYWRVTTSAGNGGQASLGLSSTNGATSFVIDAQNVAIRGNLLVSGTVDAPQLTNSAVQSVAYSILQNNVVC